MFGEITMEKIIDRTDDDLSNVKENLGRAYIIADKIDKSSQSEEIRLLLAYMAEAFAIVNDWQQYYSRFNSIITGKTDKLKADNIRLRQEVEMLNKELENKTLQEVKINEIVETLQDTLDTINKNAQLIASSNGNREKQKNAIGNKSNRFIQELDTEELIRIYKSNNYSIPKDMKELYHRKYGITYNGLRERLIKAEVWKGRD